MYALLLNDVQVMWLVPVEGVDHFWQVYQSSCVGADIAMAWWFDGRDLQLMVST